MLHLSRARIPTAVLSSHLAPEAPDSLEPTVLCDVTIEGTRIVSVTAHPGKLAPGSTDLEGSLVFPGFVDAHVHLDKTHTWERAPNRSGRFFEALDTLHRDVVNWSREDLLRRAGFAMRCAWEHGTRTIRTHVDTALPYARTSHGAMAELRSAWKGRIDLQTVPLASLDSYETADGLKAADIAVEHGACALGGFSLLTADTPRHLDRLLAIASERRVGVDLHVDENSMPEQEVLRAVAEAVIRNRFEWPVVCGHCCSLAVQSPQRRASTLDLMREARIRVVSLPLCNLYLQDRRGQSSPQTPLWRGVTVIHELLDAGIAVACASDNVRDAFYAYGDYDASEVLTQAVRIAHLDSRMAGASAMVTSHAADIIGAEGKGRVAPGCAAHLVVFPARSLSEFLSRPGSPRKLVDGESLRTSCPPDYRELNPS